MWGNVGPRVVQLSPLDRVRLRRVAVRYADARLGRDPGRLPGRGSRFVCGRPGCPTVGCHPALENWEHAASADPARVATWWRQPPARGAAGHRPGLRRAGGARPPRPARARTRAARRRPARAPALRGPVAVTPTGRWMFLVRPGDPLRPELEHCFDVVRHGLGSWIPAPPSRLPEGPVRWAVAPEQARWRLPDSYAVQSMLVDALRCRRGAAPRRPAPRAACRSPARHTSDRPGRGRYAVRRLASRGQAVGAHVCRGTRRTRPPNGGTCRMADRSAHPGGTEPPPAQPPAGRRWAGTRPSGSRPGRPAPPAPASSRHPPSVAPVLADPGSASGTSPRPSTSPAQRKIAQGAAARRGQVTGRVGECRRPSSVTTAWVWPARRASQPRPAAPMARAAVAYASASAEVRARPRSPSAGRWPGAPARVEHVAAPLVDAGRGHRQVGAAEHQAGRHRGPTGAGCRPATARPAGDRPRTRTSPPALRQWLARAGGEQPVRGDLHRPALDVAGRVEPAGGVRRRSSRRSRPTGRRSGPARAAGPPTPRRAAPRPGRSG